MKNTNAILLLQEIQQSTKYRLSRSQENSIKFVSICFDFSRTSSGENHYFLKGKEALELQNIFTLLYKIFTVVKIEPFYYNINVTVSRKICFYTYIHATIEDS